MHSTFSYAGMWDRFKVILKGSNIEVLLRAIYVDDGRMVTRLLERGYRFIDGAVPKFEFSENGIERMRKCKLVGRKGQLLKLERL